MLKKFFLNLLSSFIGSWLALILGGALLLFFIFAAVGKFAISGSEMPLKVKSNSVLIIDLKGEIEETESSREFDVNMLLNGKIEKPQTLLSLLTALDEASKDSRIEALYLKCGTLSVSPATAHALHDAVIAYKKKTGNPVIAYGDVLMQSSLYIAACADSVYLNPQGQLALTGCGSVGLYMKDLFDKIGIQWQVAKVGTYKSAVEPYTSNQISDPAKQQLIELYGAIWTTIRKGIAEGRGVNEDMIDSLTNSLIITQSASEIVNTGLITSTAYEREMDDIIGKVINTEAKNINFIDAQEYGNKNSISSISGKHIAVLYATGEIQENAMGGIDCYKLVPMITKLAEDEDVVGLVLRVNSPGGSVFGSEQISEALTYFKSKKKPFVVSMGDYAASGGYWISCNADRIFADPLTVTGSIGIFGLVPNASELLKKVGVNPQLVSTNPNAMLAIPYMPLNEIQMAALQTSIDRGYKQFIEKVAKGRHMTALAVDSIAQGRVWIGAIAKRLGLVDELGSLNAAISYVANKSGLNDNKVGYYPEFEPSIWDMIPSSSVKSSPLGQMVEKAFGNQATPILVWRIENVLNRNHHQAILPQYYKVRI